MRTGGGARPGLTALGCWLGLAFLTGGLTTGCDRSGSGEAASTERPVSASPSPRPTPPEELCARVVAYWSRKVLASQTYGDYQSMGLSDGQYDILRNVVGATRAEKERHGARAADELIDRMARAGCADWYRTGGPSKGPWK
ncbi:hypothetical protein ACFYZJ_04990 [Streptomyces sp. NPDC001848]|uniref:hypothetical protein n=1 Tax=Streptomyces sp. NPDC001848 TaxID=3364618 RepID=UPI0036A0C73A